MSFLPISLFPLFSTLPYMILGIVGIGFLIGFHELGHFLFCKLFNIHTPSFSIGFGPSIIEKKIGDTHFKLAAIPLGGYVEIAGMAEVGQGQQEEAGRKDSQSFASKPFYQKLLVMFGGILFNLLFAYVALIALFSIGVPKTPLLFPLMSTTTIEMVQENSAASTAGIQTGDTIISINHEDVHGNSKLLMQKIGENADQIVTLQIARDGAQLEKSVNLAAPEDKKLKGRLGVQFALHDIQAHSFISAITEGIAATNILIKQTVMTFISLFKKRSVDGMGGPLMIIAQMTQGAQKGLIIWLILLILISINLAVLNLIPLPILDGGQIVFYTIEAIIGRPLPENVRMGIHYASWILILALLAYLTVKDTSSLLGNLFNK